MERKIKTYGLITPSVTVFYRIIEALGMRVEIDKTYRLIKAGNQSKKRGRI